MGISVILRHRNSTGLGTSPHSAAKTLTAIPGIAETSRTDVNQFLKSPVREIPHAGFRGGSSGQLGALLPGGTRGPLITLRVTLLDPTGASLESSK
jgi:hypothetical protein